MHWLLFYIWNWINSDRFKFDIWDMRLKRLYFKFFLRIDIYLFDRGKNAKNVGKYFVIRKVIEGETRRNRKIMSPIIASGSLSLWYNSPIILSTLKITLPFLYRLLPFLFFFLLFPSATILSIGQPRRRRERKRGVLLDRVFLFSLHPPASSPFIFKSPLLCYPIASRLNSSFCFCFFRFIRRASEKFHADFHAWKKLATRRVKLFKETLWSLLEPIL